MDLSYIRPPVEKKILKEELSRRHFLRKTNFGNKEIYVTTAHRSPNVMQEIGRLREISFAIEGGGTGLPADIDEFDTLPEPYCFKQLIVWDPVDEEIVGGYRFIHGTNMYCDASGQYYTPMAHLLTTAMSSGSIIFHTLSRWHVLGFSPLTNRAPTSARVFIRSTTCGTVWA